ncbi:hypothetical protein WJX75_006256 [Coccomyxa subellipsoidea]|uniref:Centrosomal protein of 162 kDa n=1 Tax=Coccomyxa subellipsoidea TaxID=248742 RepID=A0ABR2YFC7_9CHLO
MSLLGLSRPIQIMSQTSSDGAPPKLLRPSSSPAGASPAAHKTGKWEKAVSRRPVTTYQGGSIGSHKAVPASPRQSKPRMRGQAPTSQSFEGLQRQYSSLESQFATLHVGGDSRSQLRAAANREAELQAQLSAMSSKAQAEAALRQEVQAKLAEQLREADREKKALRDQLKGELRASRKEVAQLKGQMQVQRMTPQQNVAQQDTDTVHLTSKEADQMIREMGEQETLIKGYQVEIEEADGRNKALHEKVRELQAQLAHLEKCLQEGQAERTHPKPNASDAAQNLTAVLELQKQLQETRDVGAEKEKELSMLVSHLRSTCTTLEKRLLDSEETCSRAEERAVRAEEDAASLTALQAREGVDPGADAELLHQHSQHISRLQAHIEASESGVAAAQQRITELQTKLEDTQRDLARKEAAIQEHCAEEARKQQAASRRLSNSAPQKENKGIAAHQRVKELETQLKEERVAWARKESLHKNQLKKAQQEVQEAATRTATARLPRPPSTAQQQQRLKNNTIARLEADLAASKARIDQLVDQVKVMEAEQAAVDQELEGCKSMCTALDTELSEKRKVVQETAAERERLRAELAAAGQRVAAAEMAHRLLLNDRDSAIEQRTVQHQMQLEAAKAAAARDAVEAEGRAWAERVAGADADAARERKECERLQGELRAARRGAPWTPKAAEFDAVQHRIRAYKASEEARIAQALKAAEESHKEEIAARETQIMHFCQELDAITQQLESLKKAEA